MPSKKKGKGKKKARKGNAPLRGEATCSADEVEQVADGIDNILSIEDMMSDMRIQIVSSLGDGYDDKSLKAIDEKLCHYFLDEDDFYFDGNGKEKGRCEPAQKPTPEEIERYKKSDIIRKGVLRKASGVGATGNFLDGQGHKTLLAYEAFYKDLRSFHYAWFELIFKNDRKELLQACGTMIKFASVKLDVGVGVNELGKMMELVEEMKDLFQNTVHSHDKGACEDAGILEYDFYALSYRASVEFAKSNREDEAESYFEKSFSMENIWGYCDEEDRHCAKVLEFAIGRGLCSDEISEIDMYALENEGFYFRCLRAYLSGLRGSISWKGLGSDYNRIGSEEEQGGDCCNNCGMPAALLKIETGKKLLRCARCRIALYCNKECQIDHWKRGHKLKCSS
ncbi:hypothetical protein ACHAWF_008706 [Thalassiosira exigua]